MDAVYLVASNGCRSSVREVSIVLYANVRRKTLTIDLHAARRGRRIAIWLLLLLYFAGALLLKCLTRSVLQNCL